MSSHIIDEALAADLIAGPQTLLAQTLSAVAYTDPAAAAAFVARRPCALERATFVLEQHGATLAGVRKVLRSMGHANPDATIARHAGDDRSPAALARLPAETLLGLGYTPSEVDVYRRLAADPRISGASSPAAAATLADVTEGLREIGATPDGVRKVLRQLGSKPGALETYGRRALGLSPADD